MTLPRFLENLVPSACTVMYDLVCRREHLFIAIARMTKVWSKLFCLWNMVIILIGRLSHCLISRISQFFPSWKPVFSKARIYTASRFNQAQEFSITKVQGEEVMSFVSQRDMTTFCPLKLPQSRLGQITRRFSLRTSISWNFRSGIEEPEGFRTLSP